MSYVFLHKLESMLTSERLDQRLYRLCSILAIVGTSPTRVLLANISPFGYVYSNPTGIEGHDRRMITKADILILEYRKLARRILMYSERSVSI